jgi:branched-chain amino acid transport system substrate-binding protein
MVRIPRLLAVATLALFAAPALAQAPIKIVGLVELSGTGATSGTNFDNGAKLAVKEINAAGGILGRQVQYTSSDTQSNPGVAKALAQKAVDDGAYVVMGPVFSGSILVSMEETRRAEIPNFTGGEASAITQKGNPYIFRTSFTQASAMPKVARYIKNGLKAKTVDVMWVNNDFGKGGRDMIVKSLEAEGIKVGADISTDPGQVDFSSAVLKAKQSNGDALFVYTNEEESARALRELRKQGYAKPVVGETTLTSQKVIELAGEAANGAVAHVGLSADAPLPPIRAFDAAFQREYKAKADHNGLKGYSGIYFVKVITERIGKVDGKAFAAAMKGAKISVKDNPGVLMDVTFDQHGDLDRESFLSKVVNGKQVIVETLPPLGAK